jgi:hypothetical protein
VATGRTDDDAGAKGPVEGPSGDHGHGSTLQIRMQLAVGDQFVLFDLLADELVEQWIALEEDCTA